MTKKFSLDEANRMLPLVSRIVRDIIDHYREWQRTVEAFDVPPRGFSVSVALLRASTEPGPRTAPTPVAEQIRGVGARLRKLFAFTDYTPIDEVVLQGVYDLKLASSQSGQLEGGHFHADGTWHADGAPEP